MCFFALKYEKIACAIPYLYCLSNAVLLAQPHNYGNSVGLLYAVLMFQVTFCDFIWNLAFFQISIIFVFLIQIKYNEEPTKAGDLMVTLGAFVANCVTATFVQVLNMQFGMFLLQIN